MGDKCEYLYIGGMRVPMENVLITYVPYNRVSTITQSFRVAAKSPGKNRGEPPYIQTIKELKKLLKHNHNSTMVARVYDPKLLIHDYIQSGKYVGELFKFDPSKALGRAGRKHAAKEGRSDVWAQFESDEFVAGFLAKGVSYGVSEGLDEINTLQMSWLATTPAGKVVLNRILKSSDPDVNDVKHTLAAAIAKAHSRATFPLSKEDLESFAKLVPMAETLGFLKNDVMSSSSRSAASDPSTPIDLLRKLASDENEYIRRGAAENPSTPADLLRELADDKNIWVRWGVAQNPSTPVDLLTLLASDAKIEVRKGVAKNPFTPVDLLDKLAHDLLASDEDAGIRRGAAANPSTPVDSLRKLAHDREEHVRRAAAENRSTHVDSLRELADDKYVLVRRGAAENPSTPVDLLRKLAIDEEYVRQGVALNPSTPVDLLDKLARDKDRDVRRGVAKNPSTSVDLLRKLASDEYADARGGAAAAARSRAADRERALLQISRQDEGIRKTINEVYDSRYPAGETTTEILSKRNSALAELDATTATQQKEVNERHDAIEQLALEAESGPIKRAEREFLELFEQDAPIETIERSVAAVAPAKAAKTYKIGDAGPAGGTIFAIKSGMYLEVAPEDIGRLTWRDAISAAQNYEHNGFSDWYLPSQNELDAMYEKRDMIGGFSTDNYWSSSEYGGNGAWFQYFVIGNQGYSNKNYTNYVRPVRAFSI